MEELKSVVSDFEESSAPTAQPESPPRRRAPRFSVPTLVMTGDKEKIYDAGAALARAEALIPGVRTLSVPDASHDLMFSQPARVNAALKAFLADTVIPSAVAPASPLRQDETDSFCVRLLRVVEGVRCLQLLLRGGEGRFSSSCSRSHEATITNSIVWLPVGSCSVTSPDARQRHDQASGPFTAWTSPRRR
jgi:hypothetical protein